MRVGNPGTDGKYNLVMEALICEAIAAWRYEREKYRLTDEKDGKSWKVLIELTQSQAHTAGFSIGLTGTEKFVRWTILPNVGSAPSSSLLHQVVAKVEVGIPGNPQAARNIQELYSAEEACDESKFVVNLHPIGIRGYFAKYIDSFKESGELIGIRNNQIITNFKYENTAKISASADPKFTFALQPYGFTFGPSFEYENKIFLKMLITRFVAQSAADKRRAYLKMIRDEARKAVAIQDEIAKIRRDRGENFPGLDLLGVLPPPGPGDDGFTPRTLAPPAFPEEEFYIRPDPFSQESEELLRRAIDNLPPQ